MELEGKLLTNNAGIELLGQDGLVSLALELNLFDDEHSYVGLFTTDRTVDELMKDLDISSFSGFDQVTAEALWQQYRMGQGYLHCYQ